MGELSRRTHPADELVVDPLPEVPRHPDTAPAGLSHPVFFSDVSFLGADFSASHALQQLQEAKHAGIVTFWLVWLENVSWQLGALALACAKGVSPLFQ